MDYREAMQMLSQCGLGVLVADADERIIEANDAAEQLLQDGGKLEGRLLADIAPASRVRRKTKLPPGRLLARGYCTGVLSGAGGTDLCQYGIWRI